MEPILQGPCWVLLHQAASRRLSVRAMVGEVADTAADPVPGAEVTDGGIRQLHIWQLYYIISFMDNTLLSIAEVSFLRVASFIAHQSIIHKR